MYRPLSILLIQALVGAHVAHAGPVTVSTAQELRQAIRHARIQDTTIIVDADRIELGGEPLRIAAENRVVDLVGVPRDDGSRPVIDFQMHWDGDWERYDPERTPANGIDFRSRSSWVRGLTFTGYEWRGSALRVDATELIHIQDCLFEGISTKVWPTRLGEQAQTVEDAWQGNVIGGGARGSHILIDGCTFRRAVLSNQYAHCIYLNNQPSSLTVTNCTFEEVGRPVVTSQPGIIRMFNNTYRNMQKVPSARSGVRAWTYWVGPSDNLMTVMFERFENATFRWPIRSRVNQARHVFEYNDYSGLRIEGDDVARGEWKPATSGRAGQPRMDWADWRKAGFDQHSEPPGTIESTSSGGRPRPVRDR